MNKIFFFDVGGGDGNFVSDFSTKFINVLKVLFWLLSFELFFILLLLHGIINSFSDIKFFYSKLNIE